MTQRKQDRPAVVECAWCRREFAPRSFRNRFCSEPCTTAFHNASKLHECGPCPGCGTMFRAKTPGRKYCTHRCFIRSPQFQTMRAENWAKLQAGRPVVQGRPIACKGCGVEFVPAGEAKYCTPQCRRRYFAERFDRWVADPQAVALPQNFDEFLARDTLTCPVDGCDWEGTALGNHVNLAHGITARQFKMLCGFNLTSGLVGESLAEKFADNVMRRVAEGELKLLNGAPPGAKPSQPTSPEGYVSLERKERLRKAMADTPSLSDKFLPCRGCGTQIQQPYAGRKWFCTTQCRDADYARRLVVRRVAATCGHCGNEFKASYAQSIRIKRGESVCCSPGCRTRMNLPKMIASRRAKAVLDDGPVHMTCGICGVEFTGTRNQVPRWKKGLPVCCSNQCRWKMNNPLASKKSSDSPTIANTE